MKHLLFFLSALALALLTVPPTLRAPSEALPSPTAVLSVEAPASIQPAELEASPVPDYAPVLLAEDLLPAAPEAEDTPTPTPAPTPVPPTIRLLQGGKVVTLPLEEYVLGATAAEMPPWFPAAALEAQAVAVRTLALRNLTAAASGNGKHTGADLCANPACCMAYSEPEAAAEAVRQAVEATAGEVVTYRGEPILAAFCAAVSGKTKSSAAVWGGALDYLVPVASPEQTTPGGHGVGMSQYGAAALAEQGLSAEEILKHYYTGVELTTWAECSAQDD